MAVPLDPELPPQYVQLRNSGRYEELAHELQIAIAGDPQSATLHYWLGRSYYELHDYNRAESSLERAAVLAPERSEFHDWLGKASGRKAEHANPFSAMGLARLAGILVAAVLIGAWTAWAVLARLTLYEVTDAARIEVDQAAHPIQSPLLGRIVKTNLAIGREVLAGDVLIELDAQPQRLQIREEQTLLSTLPSQIEALRAQRAAEEQSRRNEQQTARAAQEEARAGVRKAEAPERLAEVEQQRLKDLRAEGLIAERDFQRGAAEVQERKADVESQQLTIPRLQREQQTRESDREALVRQIDAQVQALDTQLATAQAEVGRLQYEVERRTIRAPIAGRIAEAAVLRAGSVVDEGDRLGAIVPSGKLRVIAQFPPPAALGRIRPGQTARVRLQGFPWTQYGSVAASVTEVASEVRDGTVRVDLAVVSQPPAIPLQHGLPGSVEVEVERISPARLVLRHAGRLLTQPRSAFAAENTSRGVN